MIDILRARLERDERIRQGLEFFAKTKGEYALYGLAGEAKAVLLGLGIVKHQHVLLIAHDDDEQRMLCDELTQLLPQHTVLPLPPDEGGWLTVRAASRESSSRRASALDALQSPGRVVVVATIQSAAERLPDAKRQLEARIELQAGSSSDLSDLLQRLNSGGYERAAEIEGHGQFAVRGGIVDIFPANFAHPLRVEYWGDEIDSMRYFSVEDQRSLDKTDSVTILPFRLSDARNSDISSYLSADTLVVLDESSRARDTLKKILGESGERRKEYLNFEDLMNALSKQLCIHISSMASSAANVATNHIVGIQARPIPPYRRRFDVFINDCRDYIARGYAVFVAVSSQERVAELAHMAEREDIRAAQFFLRVPKTEQVDSARLYIVRGALQSGMEWVGAKTLLVCENDLFSSRKTYAIQPQNSAVADKREVFIAELKVGDYVVHNSHGVGRYVGVETLTVDGMHKDYFHIQYSGTDKLFVPVEQVHLLQRFVGGEDTQPRLSKLGSGEWEKKKSRAKKAVEDIARDLLAVQAGREAEIGVAHLPDNDFQNDFEAAFPYAETADQLRSIAEIKRDMESPQPMERLLCGDVGFGKTEVAMRAAFKAVMSGYQVALLAPTTVLALQHYNNFHMRCAGFGVKVGLNCRLVREETKKLTMNAAREGAIDIIIGTHGLLREETPFKKIGLVIVDEEQRFGVKQKEYLKKWKGNADILSLSATPIPRTLHMALGGARDMSVIETPPHDRLPVQTYVIEATDEVVRQAIRKELNRGGQVFFVYNRVATMDKVFMKLKQVVPEARIIMAHGQMPEEAMESAITEFFEGQYDVLLATTIVENGVDMPNVNTVIIYDADRLGLAQLHQLRGRVGRSNRQAYAYFLYRENKVVNEIAEHRLRAVQDFTELGVGFKIAMRDLEIRGAGEILGARQHGHIAGVGFMLYSKMLEEAIARARGGQPVELPLEPRIDIPADGYIPGGYVPDAMHKIGIYQRIAAARNEDDVRDVLDELIDRFGEPPKPVLILLDVALLKSKARALGVAEVGMVNDALLLVMSDKPDINPENIANLQKDKRYRVALKLQPPGQITVNFVRPAKDILEAALETVGQLL